MTFFWITAFLLTLIVIVYVARPALRRAAGIESDIGEFEHDVEVYRHQLQELDQEATRGVIASTDAEQARAEIARRLIAAQEKASAERHSKARHQQSFGTVFLASMMLAFVPAMTLIVYLGFGSPDYADQPLAARLEERRIAQDAARQSQDEMIALVARAEAHLADNPDDGQGWAVLAPVYLRLGQPISAVEAYTNANRLLGETPDRLSGLGEALFARGLGVVDDEALAAFQKANALNPSDGRARFYLALAAIQKDNIDKGQEGWQALAADEQADPQWRAAAQEGINRLASGDMTRIPGMAGQTAPGMPRLDDDTIASAQSMSDEDRQQMIAGMVDRLSQRLEDNPSDFDGWRRLIRAYVVMGKRQSAQDAMKRAIENFSENEEAKLQLAAFAASLGLSPEGENRSGEDG